MKEELQGHFDFLATMSIKELTLYRTWHQINNGEWVKKNLGRISEIKNNMWIPEEPDDYLKIEPEIIIPTKQKEHLEWRILRYFVSSAPTLPIPGRGMRITVKDRITGKYLGIMELCSDFATLKPRDEYIGWSKKIKEGQRMLNYLAMGSTIVPMQPLGYNYLGGKFMSLLLVSDVVENAWNAKYPQPVIAFTTTSLFGGYSQYTGLKYWKKCGTTEGKVLLEPDDSMNLKLRHWMRDNYPEDFEKAKKASRMKTRISYYCYTRLKVRPPENKAPRGVYFCELYDNVVPFLNKQSDNYGERKFDNRLNSLVDLWKKKYASKRIKNMLKKGNYNNDILFYDDLIGMKWKDAKAKYIDRNYVEPVKKEDLLEMMFE